MASRADFSFMLHLPLALFLIISLSATAVLEAKHLKVGFYGDSCPDAEKIIFDEMKRALVLDPLLAPALLRLHFHDCFMRGCDGSVLLNSTKTTVASKDHRFEISLRGFGEIDRVKALLEEACPGVISCADILALVARDVVYLTKGPYWRVPTGRRDGLVSKANDTVTLPPPSANYSLLLQMFKAQGLNKKDLVVLSGAHTIGISHCGGFAFRLYNYTGHNDSDPTIDPAYLQVLKQECPRGFPLGDIAMDLGSNTTFDTHYYKTITESKTLFHSDMALLEDPYSKAYVESHAAVNNAGFFKDFKVSIIKMGKIGVLTGKEGEIRNKCWVANSH